MFDGIFSSLTSLNFILAGLYDLNIIDLTNKYDKFYVILAYIFVYICYYGSYNFGWYRIWQFLYIDLTTIGSFTFFSIQLLIQFNKKLSNKFKINGGKIYLILALIIGITGLSLLQNPIFAKILCNSTDGWFDSMDLWYIHSDLSLLCLLLYIIHSRKNKTDNNNNYYKNETNIYMKL